MWSLFTFLGALSVLGVSAEPLPGSDTAEFALVKRNHGISLYERWYESEPDLSAREVKATFVLNVEPEAAISLIRNQARGRDWNKNTRDYKVVAVNDDKWICYLQYDLPWPLNNQDCVLEHSQYRQGNSIYVPFEAVEHPEFPENSRVQRIPAIRGKWVFTPDPAGTRVDYYITTTPSGSLPTWVTDPVIRNNLIASLQAFRDILHTGALTKR